MVQSVKVIFDHIIPLILHSLASSFLFRPAAGMIVFGWFLQKFLSNVVFRKRFAKSVKGIIINNRYRGPVTGKFLLYKHIWRRYFTHSDCLLSGPRAYGLWMVYTCAESVMLSFVPSRLYGLFGRRGYLCLVATARSIEQGFIWFFCTGLTPGYN